MKKNPRLEARRKMITRDIDIYVNKSFAIAERIHLLLQILEKDQKFLADKLGKKESEISKWMSGTHNFTLRTISLIENALNDDVLVIAGKELRSEQMNFIYIHSQMMQIPSKNPVYTIKKSTEYEMEKLFSPYKNGALA